MSQVETKCHGCFYLFGMTGKHEKARTGYCRRYPEAVRIASPKSYVCGEWRDRDTLITIENIAKRLHDSQMEERSDNE